MEFINLELKFDVERFKRHLQAYPDKAAELAIAYFEKYLLLSVKHKRLEQNYQTLQIENLKSHSTHKSTISLLSFLQSNRGAS